MLEKHEYCAIILKKEEFANGNGFCANGQFGKVGVTYRSGISHQQYMEYYNYELVYSVWKTF